MKMTLAIDHMPAPEVGVLSTSGSCGQLLVYERSVAPGRSVFAQVIELGVVAEHAGVMARHLAHRFGAVGRQRDRAGRRVIGIAPHLLLETGVEGGLRAHLERLVGLAELALGPDGAQRQRLAMQPVGRPVRRDVAAVAPHRTELLAAGRQPGLLAELDLSLREQDGAIAAGDQLRDGRGGQVDFLADPAEYGEGQGADNAEPGPEFARGMHDRGSLLLVNNAAGRHSCSADKDVFYLP
jgi:hypothetical protein